MSWVSVGGTFIIEVTYGGQRQDAEGDGLWEVVFTALSPPGMALEEFPAEEVRGVLNQVVDDFGGSTVQIIGLVDGLRIITKMHQMVSNYHKFILEVVTCLAHRLRQNPALQKRCRLLTRRRARELAVSRARGELEKVQGRKTRAFEEEALAQLALGTAERALRTFEEDQAVG